MKTTAAAVERWDRMFRILQIYFRNHGHADVPPAARGDSLYQWLEEQRAGHRLGRLNAEQVRQLDALGIFPGTSASSRAKREATYQARWDKHFAKLVAFKKRFGHCDVPCHWPEDRLFGRWISHQRSFRNQGQLKPQRVARLEELGFKWAICYDRDVPSVSMGEAFYPLELRWQGLYEQLRQFKKRHGHCIVGSRSPQDALLGAWVQRQRDRARAGQLSPHRRRLLDRIGFCWNNEQRHEDTWNRFVAKLAAFKKKSGHADVPCDWKGDRPLGLWLSNQRVLRHRGWLSQERIDRLDQLGIKWHAGLDQNDPVASDLSWRLLLDRQWEEMFGHLRQFKKQHGHCRVTGDDGHDGRLWQWAKYQREYLRKHKLPAARRLRLDKMGFVWEDNYVNQERWEKQLAKLVAYKKRFGHCDVPMKWPEDRGFAHWVSNQRCFRRKGRLSQDRIDRLDQVGISWIVNYDRDVPPGSYHDMIRVRDLRWSRRYEQVCAFKKKHGSLNLAPVLGAGSPLHKWLQRQRHNDKAKCLTAGHRRLLLKIGFNFDGRQWTQDRWLKRYTKLAAFKKRFGHCDIPMHWPEDRGLAHWVSNQRSFRKKGCLSPDRIDRLEKLGFTWAILEGRAGRVIQRSAWQTPA